MKYIIQTHPSLLQTQARRCSVKTSWLTDCCSPCHTSISHFRYTSVRCHLGSILIAGALFSDLTVIRVHISAIRQPHIWQDEFWRLTCKMPLKSAAISFAICCRPSVCLPSVCRLPVVCNVRAPYSGGSHFRQYFYVIRYLGHPVTFTENFKDIFSGEPLRRKS